MDTYVEPLGHNHLPAVIDPTYTKPGYTAYVCERCGDSYVEDGSETAPLGLPVPVVSTENDPTTGKPVLGWEADGEADHYEIYRSTSGKKNYKRIDTAEEATYTDHSAKAGTAYYYKVKAVCEADGSLSSKQSAYKSCKCLYPKPVAAVSYTSGGSPKITWEKISGAKKYDVYYSTTETGSYKKLVSTSSASYTHSKAASGKTYFYKVRAYGSSSSYAGEFSEIVSGVKKLAAPTITVTVNHDTRSAKITWKKITGAIGYDLQYKVGEGAFVSLGTVTGTSYTHENLTVGDTYTYRLGALSDKPGVSGNYSTEKSVTVKCGKPVLSVSYNADGKPVLSWNVIEGAVKYELQMATSTKGKFKTLATVTDPMYLHSEAVGGKTYYYKVRAIDANGTAGALTSYKSATCKCKAPEITEVTTSSSGYPTVKWGKVTGAKKYEVWYKAGSAGSYKKLTTTSSTSYTYSKAKMDTQYYFKIRAYGSSTSSLSEYSNEVLALRKLAKPGITLTTSQTSRKITIKWKKVTNAIGYELQCSVNGGAFTTISANNKLSFVHEGLAPGNKYTYRLRALSSKAETISDFCAEKSATIKVGKPTLTIALSESGKPMLTWEAVEGAKEYQIWYATSKNGKYKKLDTVTGLTFTHEAATKGKTCYFKVRAADINSTTGDYSSIKSIKSK